jgi:hypothetical protein
MRIEFQNIDNNQGTPPKKLFLPFKCYNLAVRVVSFSEVFSTGHLHSILWLEVEKHYFI